jgi:hypothetical protein
METTGAGLTTMVNDFAAEHPLEPVPVTEYVVVALGFTVILAVVSPVLHW